MGNKKISAYVTEDGEIIDVSQENKRIIVAEKGERIIRQKQIEHAIKEKQRREDLTDFVWVKFQYNQPLYQAIKPNVVARMFCLATHTNTDGYTATRQNIRVILNGINDGLITEFVSTMNEQGIMTPERGGKYRVNRECFYRGDMDECTENHIRLFTEATRALYRSVQVTKQCYMAYIMQMIPFVNRQTNILCRNQTEQSIECIEYMKLKDYCAIMGMDVTHVSRIREQLLKLRINGELAVGFFNDSDSMELIPNGKYVVVNPALFYGGERKKEYHSKVCGLFKAEKRMRQENN